MRQLLTYLFILWSFAAFAQNLVPNGSFEDYTTCPNNLSEIYLAPPWTGEGTVDYFNSCNNSINNIVGVPSNSLGVQNAFNGNAYSGIVCLWLQGFGWEFLQVKLSQKLDSGKVYCIRFYVNLADSSSYAIDSLGAYVSDTTFDIPSSILNLPLPQAINISPITDKENWTLIEGSFTANGNEQLITIGNFGNMFAPSGLFVGGGCTWNANTNPSCVSSYYYIDSVSVTLCPDPASPSPPTESNITIPNVFTPNGDGINDLFLIETTAIESMSCEIFNRWGIKVATLSRLNEGWDGRTTSGQEAIEGVYYYMVNARNEKGEKITKKGFVQLLR